MAQIDNMDPMPAKINHAVKGWFHILKEIFQAGLREVPLKAGEAAARAARRLAAGIKQASSGRVGRSRSLPA